jgi:TIR domain
LLEYTKRPAASEHELDSYLKKVQVFLSHSKHDAHGQAIANKIRNVIHMGHGLSSFFDVNDIPAGIPFSAVLLHAVRVSAVIAIYTDSYSSREWCRREMIEAKRRSVPLVVLNCLHDRDERAFPYLGNVPAVRLSSSDSDRIAVAIGSLLDEVLRDFIWRCRVSLLKGKRRLAVFLPRPPELISLTALAAGGKLPTVLVYPDPPLGSEEEALFREVAPHAEICSLTEWIAKSGS